MLDKIFCRFEHVNPSEKDLAESIGDACLTPLRYVFGHQRIKADGANLYDKRNILDHKVRRVAAGVFAVLLFPLSGLLTLVGIASLYCSQSHGRACAHLFPGSLKSGTPQEEGGAERQPAENQRRRASEAEKRPETPELRDSKERSTTQPAVVVERRPETSDEKMPASSEDSPKPSLVRMDSPEGFVFVDENPRKYRERPRSERALQTPVTTKKDAIPRHDPTSVPVSYHDKKLSGNSILRVYATEGDGSCGIHALLGTPFNGTYLCDAAKERKAVADWVLKLNQAGKLPEEMDAIISKQFTRMKNGEWGKVPLEMQTPEVMKVFEETMKIYGSLKSFQDKLSLVSAFARNETVLKGYLAHMKKTNVWMLQEEVVLAAKCFDKTIVLYQPGWGKDSHKLTGKTLNPGKKDIVPIYYNGISHYERAAIVKIV